MIPTKMLIAQRLDECAREIAAIVSLMDDHRHEPRWSLHAAEMARAGELASYWAAEIRDAEK